MNLFCRNASLALCQCEKDDWKAIHKGFWSSVMSPYDYRYVDLKLVGEVSDPITLSIVEGMACLFKRFIVHAAQHVLFML